MWERDEKIIMSYSLKMYVFQDSIDRTELQYTNNFVIFSKFQLDKSTTVGVEMKLCRQSYSVVAQKQMSDSLLKLKFDNEEQLRIAYVKVSTP